MSRVDELVQAGRRAQEQVAGYTQGQIDDVCLAVGWALYNDENVHELSKLAVEETGYGNYESKVVKHKRKVGGAVEGILGKVSVGLVERDEASGISKYAKPVGLVCAILPATNPTATAGTKAVAILKGRNAVIFRPSSRARKASSLAVEYMRAALRQVGAPEDLVQVYDDADIPSTAELMQKCDLVVATGGGPMVRAAYSSGTPSYGVGVGNAVCIIAEDADVQEAVSMITASKTFDYATSCSSENSIIVQRGILDGVLAEIRANRGHVCTPEEKAKLRDWMWQVNDKGRLAMNGKIVAQPATRIAADAGIEVPEDTRMLVVMGEEPAVQDKFADEKMSPVLTLFTYETFDEALEKISSITNRYGRGHSMGIHTYRPDYIERMGQTMLTSRITVRQPMAAANGGHATNHMPPTATLGCGTWGKNSTTENIHYRHFLNVTWVNEPRPARIFSEEAVWGEFHARYATQHASRR
jgi:sulfoacetaldehyde dehydrogenase